MANTVYREYRARIAYPCEWGCGHPIPAGSTYVRASLPPGSELGNRTWWSIRVHGRNVDDCPGKPQMRTS